jgi:hypothetical protein
LSSARKKLVVTVIVLLFIIQFSLSIVTGADYKTSISDTSSKLDESHLIEGVPYVGQKTDFYCAYASVTMMLKYYGINTTQYEIVFNSGGGYSLIYSHPKLKRLVVGSAATSVWENDHEFLAELYGLSYKEDWFAYDDITNEEKWDEYWLRAKENISNDVPVLTWVDPTGLASIRDAVRKGLNVSEELWDKLPEIVWYFFPSTISHVIVLVGYNENNGTICFNDPGAYIFGYPECGTYKWMNISDYKRSMKNLLIQSEMAYLVSTFHNISDNPLNKTEMFEKAYERNIEKMKGNLTKYDEHITNIWGCEHLGINALKKLKQDFEPGLKNRFATILRYKLMNFLYLRTPTYMIYKLFDKIFPEIVNISDFESTMVYYYQLVLEREDISRYLEDLQYEIEDENLSEICKNDSILLKQEADNYTKIAEYYSEFHKKGVFLTFPKAIQIINKMKEKIEEIIQIEETIIGNFEE